MHVIEPTRYQSQARRHRRVWPYLLAVLLIVGVAGTMNYYRPLPSATTTIHITAPRTITPIIAWPAAGQAAVGASGYGILGTFGSQQPLATASIAKVITALCVLQKEPLQVGQAGPTYTVGATDVAIYQNYVAEDGSLLPVQASEQLTEYQALEALMIPSANNIADSLVQWVFGSQAAYATYATNYLQQHNIDNTHIGSDASGFDPSTTSVASDLTQIGLLAAQNPVLMQIVAQPAATFPVIGTVQNYDTVLGEGGINGIKTGNNAIDLGAFLFSATKQIGNQTIQLGGAIMGAPDLNTALQESVSLATSLEDGFKQITVLQVGQVVGVTHTPWGGSTMIRTTKALQLINWRGTPITVSDYVNPKTQSNTIGTARATAGPNSATVSLRLDHALARPSFLWRLTRH